MTKLNMFGVVKIFLFSLLNAILSTFYFRYAYQSYCDYVTRFTFDCSIFLGLTMGVWVFVTSLIVLSIVYLIEGKVWR